MTGLKNALDYSAEKGEMATQSMSKQAIFIVVCSVTWPLN